MATEKKNAANSKSAAAPDSEEMKSTMEPSTETQASRLEKISPLLMTLIVAIPAAAIIAYINIPKSSDGSLPEQNIMDMSYQSQMPPRSADNWSHSEQPAWVAQRRAEMEKRRAEFEKKNAGQFSFNDNDTNFSHTEPPQWVKDQQAKMEQEQVRYQEQMAKQMAAMRNNRAFGPMNYQAMNMPPMATANQNYQTQPWQNQPPVNAYPQAPVPYHNGYMQPVTPYYYNGPYGYPY